MSCEVCKEQKSKYKCPGCSTKTCSLQCVKQHKRARQCSGKRNKTAYVPVKQFTESHLLSDYRFLEDVDRKRYTAITDPNLKLPAKSNDGFLPKELYRLKQAAKHRGINLKILPATFSRHKNNTTAFKQIGERRSLLHWRVEWIFAQSDDATYVNESLAENSILRDALEEYIHQTKGNPVYRQRLKQYCAEGIDAVRLFMNIESLPGGKTRYKELKLDKTVAGNLAHTVILEYPTIIVVLKDHADQYVPTKKEPRIKDKMDTSSTKGSVVSIPTSEDRISLLKATGNSSQPEGNVTHSTEGSVTQPTEGNVTQPTVGGVTQLTEGSVTQPTEGNVTQPTEDSGTQPTESSVTQPTEGGVAQPKEDSTEHLLMESNMQSSLEESVSKPELEASVQV